MRALSKAGYLSFLYMFFVSSAFGSLDTGPVISKNELKKKIYGLQVPFVENHGQEKDGSVRFYANTFAGTVFVTEKGEMVYSLPKSVSIKEIPEHPKEGTGHKAQKTDRIKGINKSGTKVNYFTGNKDNWRTNIETWQEIAMGEIYDGVELDLKAYGNNVEKIFTVHPAGKVEDIMLRIEGAKGLQVNEAGELEVETEDGTVKFSKPAAYQEQKRGSAEAQKEFIEVAYVVKGNEYGFMAGNYDHTRPLIIDPVLSYSTYLGGGSAETGYGIAVDKYGNVYVTGETSSVDFPVQVPFQLSKSGGPDVFVTKIDPAGSAIIYSTFIGGNLTDRGYDIAVDDAGNAYVTGMTSSTNFPTMNAYKTSNGGAWDPFILKLDAAGSALIYSTYFGGYSNDYAYGIAIDQSGNAYITGETTTSPANSTPFPLINPIQPFYQGQGDAFVSKFDATGFPVYSTYLGGSGFDRGYGIAVDSSGNAYITGSTWSTNFPTQNPFQPAISDPGYHDAFVTKINSDGTSMIYSTYIGGATTDYGYGIAVDTSENAYITGYTGSTNFPTRDPFQPVNDGGDGAFITKFDSTGSALIYSTYFGRSNGDRAYRIAVDASGSAHVTGNSIVTNYPYKQEAFAARVNAAGTGLIYSTYLGGQQGTETGQGVAADCIGNTYVVGTTASDDFPVTAGVLQGAYAGGGDVFVAKISDDQNVVNLSVTKTDDIDPLLTGQQLTYTITVSNNCYAVADNVVMTDTLPGGVTFISAAPSQGSCSELNGTVTCDIGMLSGNSTVTVSIVVIPNIAGLITNTTELTSTEADVGLSDNTVTETTLVEQGYTITVTKDGTGSGTVLIGGPGGPVVCGNDCQASYPPGIGIVLDIITDADSEFAGWSGNPDCADGNVLMDADKTCTATFNLQSHSLIIGKPGNGSGTVTSVNAAGIDCGNDCSELFTVGAIVTLQATADQWNVFSGWGGDPDCADGEVTIGDADVTCFAVFNIQTYALTVDKAGTGSGVVISNEPGGIDCGLDCASAEKTYNGGTEVTLSAGTELPWIFTGWSGDPDCADGIVTMDADKTCIATFIPFEDLQFQQMQRLRNESQKTPEFRIERGIPRFISMRVPIPAALPDGPVIQALDFLDRYKYLYRINAPKSDLYLKRIKTNRFDEIGGGTPDPSNIKQHLFFGQQKDGIPVYGANLAVHMKGNIITSTNGNYLTDLPDFKLPAVQAPAAEAIALEAVQGNNKKITGVTRLFYYNKGLTAVGGGQPDPSDTPTRLAWRVMVRGLRNSDGAGTSWRLFIDAQDGTVLSKIDELRTDRAEKDFDIETANNTTSDTCWNGFNTDDDEWFDESGETGYPGADDDNYGDGRNAFDFAHFTYDFYFNNFHHHSWNNGQGVVCGIFGCPGEAQVEVMVHVGNNWDNASYIPACDHLRFGDGYVSDDTFAHEYTHAVTRWSAGLEYENQSGALDESYSDVMAAMLDNDWLQSEGIAPLGEDGERGGTRGGTSDKDGNIVGDGVREKGSECDNGVANDGGGNGVDDDEDGFIDEGCPETDIDCGNGQDDDGDGFNDEGCPETGNNCGDGNDDDGDTYIDEGCPGSCQDGIDNGLTGEADSADTDCILRDLADPSRKGDPDHINANMSGDGYGIRVLGPGTEVNCDRNDTNYNDCGWVHTNSSIMNKAAYLLTMGGVHTGSPI